MKEQKAKSLEKEQQNSGEAGASWRTGRSKRLQQKPREQQAPKPYTYAESRRRNWDVQETRFPEASSGERQQHRNSWPGKNMLPLPRSSLTQENISPKYGCLTGLWQRITDHSWTEREVRGKSPTFWQRQSSDQQVDNSSKKLTRTTENETSKNRQRRWAGNAPKTWIYSGQKICENYSSSLSKKKKKSTLKCLLFCHFSPSLYEDDAG